MKDLGCAYLLLSATLDGDIDTYLDDLADLLDEEAQHIWGSCVGAPQPARGAALKRYLLHNQLATGLFFSAYPDATVPRVRSSLHDRDRTIAFAVRAQAIAPLERQRAFLEEF
jgi:hypothetical protein